MSLLLRAIITGFGYKLGAELARYAATRVGLIEKESANKDSKDESIPDGITTVPEDGEPEPERDEDDEQPS